MNTMESMRGLRTMVIDRDKALHAALLQFWETGYETTSVAELTHAMGITAPSLYTAFRDKESLFLECLQKYANPGPKITGLGTNCNECMAKGPVLLNASHDSQRRGQLASGSGGGLSLLGVIAVLLDSPAKAMLPCVTEAR